MASTHLLFVFLFLGHFPCEQGFYVPGVAPVEFRSGDPIEVKAIKLSSTKTIVPYEYYYLPFCRPEGDLLYKSENLGEVMRGDRIVNTPYQLFMKKDIACASACTRAEPVEVSSSAARRLMDRIKEDYHAHLLVDNLPSATKYEVPKTGEIFYDLGYKIGWVGEDGKVFLNNHLDIVMLYHEHMPGLYRVVGFEVKPRSIKSVSFSKDKECTGLDKEANFYELKEEDQHIQWTYSVTWEPSDIPWASRWDVYLSVKAVDIHWFSILNSIVVVLSLSGFLSVSIVRTVRRDIAHYNKDEAEDDTLEETGWKLVHGDVFRPPPHQMILVNMVGTGIQLLGMVGVIVFFAMLGMLSPASRGSLMSAAVFLFCFMGLVSGYQSGRLYKTLKGRNPIRCAIQTGTLFPSLILGSGFVLNFFLIGKQSSGAVPFGTMIALLLMWFGIDLPLVFLGFYFGYRKQPYTHPVRTNQIPRQVPDQPWYLRTVPCTLIAGVLPFGAMFIELFFIFSAIWENQFYYLFGFLFIVCMILVISTAQISVVATYFMLCAENYRWWWKSFIVSGGSAVYVMAYSIFYYVTKLDIEGFVPTVLYFSYSALMAITFWFLTGTIGFYASYAFLRRIYAAVKID
uniref:Transmembrane 9 superfamily member n=1 Tax=Haemonchus contortus TaxID=6289 RepID=A0A7I4XVM0_HAECO|nr:Nonaspanin (TM9SF) domain containing protein [Haemonchus contortus]